MFKFVLVLAATLVLGVRVADAAGTAAPGRIVSFNSCADQLLIALADPGQIAGLSPYATDPALSVTARRAGAFRSLDWSAESVINLAPDLVLVGPTDRPTQAMLEAMKVPIASVAFVSDLDAARAQIRAIARLVGHPERGERMIADLDRAAAHLAATATAAPRTALVIERGGYAAGPRSLIAAMLKLAGLSAPPRAPRGYGGFVSLEDILVARPDLLVVKDEPDVARDQGALFLTHPALKALYPPERRIVLPPRYTLCGGPALIEGLDFLAGRLARD